jgi:hypothetical protein
MPPKALLYTIACTALIATSGCQEADDGANCGNGYEELKKDISKLEVSREIDRNMIIKISGCYAENRLHPEYNKLEFQDVRKFENGTKLYVFSLKGVTNLRLAYQVDSSGSIQHSYQTTQPYMELIE